MENKNSKKEYKTEELKTQIDRYPSGALSYIIN